MVLGLSSMAVAYTKYERNSPVQPAGGPGSGLVVVVPAGLKLG